MALLLNFLRVFALNRGCSCTAHCLAKPRCLFLARFDHHLLLSRHLHLILGRWLVTSATADYLDVVVVMNVHR